MEYFKKRYDVDIKEPTAPLVFVHGPRRIAFPMELCKLLPDQRIRDLEKVRIARNSPESFLLPPMRRQALTMDAAQKMRLFDQGFVISDQPILVDARKLNPPTIVCADNEFKTLSKRRLPWGLPRQYLRKIELNRWAVAVICQSAFDAKNMVLNLCNVGMSIGMKIQMPNIEYIEFESLEKYFQYLDSEHTQFLLVIATRKLQLQDKLKYLERKYEITTQNINTKTAMQILENKRQTIANVCHKMNIKLGGINYSLQKTPNGLLNGRCLFLGVAVAPKLKLSNSVKKNYNMPRVFGYAGNLHSAVEDIFGDFVLADYNDSAQNPMASILEKALRQWMECTQQRNDFPKLIIIYRNSLCAESGISQAIEVEIPALKAVIQKLFNGGKV